MERERKKHEESDEEMYLEIDFTPSTDDLNCKDDFDDSSSLSDAQDRISRTPNLRLPILTGQIHCSNSNSIPIHSCNQKSPPTSELNTPSTWESLIYQSEQRTISPPSMISRSVAGTPTSSVSPSSSFIPRILRESFSKLLHRGSVSRAKTPDREQACSDSECYNCDERRASECTIVSPATEEIVNESLRNGLPIIPFVYPTFFTAGKKQEDVKRQIRKNSLKSMKRSFSEGRCLDYSEGFEKYEETLNKKFSSEDKSLDSIVRMAKQEIESNTQGKNNHPAARKESQSSYVEMDPGEVLSTEITMTSNEDPYMRMGDFLNNGNLHLERKKKSDDSIFLLEDCHGIQQISPFMMPCDLLGKKPPKRKNNLFQKEKGKGELLEQESMGRNFKKGNKHKDDYVFFDFEQNKDYVDMGKIKTKKRQFFDFMSNK